MKRCALSFTLMILIFFVFFVPNVGAEETLSHGEIVQFSGDRHIESHERVTGDLVLFNGHALIDGIVEGDVVCFAGNITVNGEIWGDAVSLSGTIARGSQGVIQGDMVSLESGMGLGHMGRGMSHAFDRGLISPIFSLTFRILSLLGFAALAVLVTVLLPKQVENMGDYLENNLLMSGLTGLAALVVLPFALLIFLISIVGIPLIPLIPLAYLLTGIFGYFGVATQAGKKLAGAFKLETSPVLHVLLGVFVFWLLLRIPLLGALIWLILACFSLGSALSSKFGTLRPWFTKRS